MFRCSGLCGPAARGAPKPFFNRTLFPSVYRTIIFVHRATPVRDVPNEFSPGVATRYGGTCQMTDVPDISDESEPLSPDDIAAVPAFFPEFKDPDFSPGCVVEEEGVFPWFEHGPSVSAFLRTLYTRNVIVMFDRTGWRNETLNYYHRPDHLETADPATLRRLLTPHVRKDRYCEEHLVWMFEGGHIVAILRRPHRQIPGITVTNPYRGSDRTAYNIYTTEYDMYTCSPACSHRRPG
ncbi:MAG: DUF6508 domain-containing protein [Methanomicrobiales archaeon]